MGDVDGCEEEEMDVEEKEEENGEDVSLLYEDHRRPIPPMICIDRQCRSADHSHYPIPASSFFPLPYQRTKLWFNFCAYPLLWPSLLLPHLPFSTLPSWPGPFSQRTGTDRPAMTAPPSEEETRRV